MKILKCLLMIVTAPVTFFNELDFLDQSTLTAMAQ